MSNQYYDEATERFPDLNSRGRRKIANLLREADRQRASQDLGSVEKQNHTKGVVAAIEWVIGTLEDEWYGEDDE